MDELRNIFSVMAVHTCAESGASIVRIGDTVYHACVSGVYAGIPDEHEAKLKENTVYQWDHNEEIPVKKINNIEKLKPENMLNNGARLVFPLEDYGNTKDTILILQPNPVIGDPGIWICRNRRGRLVYVETIKYPELSAFFTIPFNVYALNPDLTIGKGVRKYITITQTKIPVLVLQQDTSLLYIAYAMLPASLVDSKFNGKIEYGEQELKFGSITPSGFYKGVVMPKQPNFSMLKAIVKKDDSNTEEVKKDSESVTENEAQQVDTKQIAAASAENLKEVDEAVTAQSEAETNSREASDQTADDKKPAEVPKQQRKRKPVSTTIRYDYTAVKEHLESTLPDLQIDQTEDISAEVRDLRDIIVAATRRITNLCTGLTKAAASFMSMSDQLKAIRDIVK